MNRECCYCEQVKPIKEFYKTSSGEKGIVLFHTSNANRVLWCRTCGKNERFQRLMVKFRAMIARAKMVYFSIPQYINWIDTTNYDELYNAYVKAGKPKKLAPSIDAIVPRVLGGKYELKNMRLLTHAQNTAATKAQGAANKGKAKTGKNTARGVTVENTVTGEIKKYRTQVDAAEAIGCSQPYISMSISAGIPIYGFPHLRATR